MTERAAFAKTPREISRLILLLLAATFDDRLQLGKYYLDRNEPGRALAEFEAALQAQPDSAMVRYYLGAALRVWGDVPGAERELRAALRLQPRFPEAHFLLGLCLGDRVGAERLGLEEFQRAIAQDPHLADAHFNIGIIHWKSGDADLAVRSFREAARLQPQSVKFLSRLGQALARAGQAAEAVAELEKAVETDPGDRAALYQLSQAYREAGETPKAKLAAAAWTRLQRQADPLGRDQAVLDYRQGLAALDHGDVDKAIDHFNAAIGAPSEEVKARIGLGIALTRKGDNEAAVEQLRKALELDPHSPDARLNLGVALLRRGDPRSAEREFRAALERDANFAAAHLNLGILFASQARWTDAAASLRKATEIAPSDARAHWNLGRVLRDSGDIEAATVAYATACRIDPSLTRAALEYGRLLPRSDAFRVLEMALRRDPLNEDLQNAYLAVAPDPEREQRRIRRLRESGYPKAVTELNQGNIDAAINRLLSLVAEYPDLAEVRRSLAMALFRNQRHAESAKQYTTLVKADPTDPVLHAGFGAALRESGNVEQSVKEFEEALRLNPDSAPVYYQLGLAHRQRGDETEAMRHFHQARRLAPSLQPPALTQGSRE